MDKAVEIREAVREDCREIRLLIQELANYEDMTDGPKLNSQALEEDGFCTYPLFKCYVAMCDGKMVGYALYFYTYTSYARKIVHLEDLYVTPAYRQKNIGSRLFNAVMKKIQEEKCQYLEFSVLGWNPAKKFYESKTAMNLTEMEGWHMFRFNEDSYKHFVTNYARDGFVVRKARLEDLPKIKQLEMDAIDAREIETQFEECIAVRDKFNSDTIKNNPYFGYIVILKNDKIMGYASYCYAYSTWEGKSLYLQRLYVPPHEKELQIKVDLLTAVIQLAYNDHCCRIDFWLLEPKEVSVFYIMHGAVDMTLSQEWHSYRLYHV